MLRLVGKIVILVLVLPALIAMGIIVATAAASQKTTPTPTAVTSSQRTNANTIYYDQIEQTPVPGAVRVTVSLTEYKITTSLLTFHAGSTYYFVVSNRGQEVHEFMIMPQKPDGSELSPADQYKNRLIELEPIAPGSTLTINFTFKPTSAGRYEIACQMRGHYAAGMKLPIQVIA